jgi:hypothetical protein
MLRSSKGLQGKELWRPFRLRPGPNLGSGRIRYLDHFSLTPVRQAQIVSELL